MEQTEEGNGRQACGNHLGRGRPRGSDDDSGTAYTANDAMARALREERIRAGLSQGQLARRLGVGQSRVSMMECGRVALDLPMLERLAAALGVHLVVGFEHAGECEGAEGGTALPMEISH